MADRLENMMQPGEQMVFRTGVAWKRWALPTLILAAMGAFVLVMASSAVWSRYDYEIGSPVTVFIVFVCGTVLIAPAMLLLILPAFIPGTGASALLTDSRLLYSGALQRRIEDIPLSHIQDLEVTSRWVTILDHTGTSRRLPAVADPRGLYAATTAAMGVPGLPVLEGKLRYWSVSGQFFVNACLLVVGFGGTAWILGFQPAIDEAIYDLSFGNPWLELPIRPAIYGGVAALAVLISVVGSTLLVTLVMAATLSATETRQVLDAMQQQMLSGPLQGDPAEHGSPVFRLPFTTARRLASRLYGEPI